MCGDMGRLVALLVFLSAACTLRASWYWPFGSDGDEKAPLRLSEIMEPATALIEEASDLAADGKVQEAIDKYRKALEELDRIEAANAERAKSPEFATLRNKRAYVGAAIDSLVMSQARQNAKAVAVSDTTELERKLAEEKAAKKNGKKPAEKKSVAKAPDRPLTDRDRAVDCIAAGRYEEAAKLIDAMLVSRPNDVRALNLKAAMEMAQGRMKEAESTLDQCIRSNPRSHYAYYNMALLILRNDSTAVPVARRYYETGRAVGGPEDAQMEEILR